MKSNDFQSAIQQDRIVAAIAKAEQQTSGEIRVAVSRRHVDDALLTAREEFTRHGLTEIRDRNAVLIFIAPVSQCFAIVGDEAVDRVAGKEFWSEVAAATEAHFRAGDFTGGLVLAIDRVGAVLARHFPRRPDDTNELPDAVIEH